MISTDEAIVHAIINPNEPFVSSAERERHQSQKTESINTEKPFSDRSEHLFKLANQERQAIKLAEEGQLDEAIDILDGIIAFDPGYASAYNNRAQIRQLRHDKEGAMHDLDRTIQVSNGKGEIAALALTQRGCLHRLQGQDDLALRDLGLAASLGSPFAKKILVTLNPYAALCNDMLTTMLTKCADGEQIYD